MTTELDWLDDMQALDDTEFECTVCGAEVAFDDRNPCDDCTGLAGCVDDICFGLGYCMHQPDSWIP